MRGPDSTTQVTTVGISSIGIFNLRNQEYFVPWPLEGGNAKLGPLVETRRHDSRLCSKHLTRTPQLRMVPLPP